MLQSHAYGSFPLNRPQYPCIRLVHDLMDRIDLVERRLLVDRTDRMLFPLVGLSHRRIDSLRRGASHKGNDPEIDGFSDMVLDLLLPGFVSHVKRLNTRLLPLVTGGGLRTSLVETCLVERSDGQEG